jgi:hypothetical protein
MTSRDNAIPGGSETRLNRTLTDGSDGAARAASAMDRWRPLVAQLGWVVFLIGTRKLPNQRVRR